MSQDQQPIQVPVLSTPPKPKNQRKMIIIGIITAIVVIAGIVTAIVLMNNKGGDKTSNSADTDTSLADGSKGGSTECKNEYYFSYNDYYDKVANPATGNSDPHCFGQKFVDAVSATGNTLTIGDYTLTFPSDWSASKAEKPEQIRVAGGGNPCAPTAACRIGTLERFGDMPTSSTRGLSVAMSTNMSAVSMDNDDSWDPMLYDFEAKENTSPCQTPRVSLYCHVTNERMAITKAAMSAATTHSLSN